MTGIAAILTMHTLKSLNNLAYNFRLNCECVSFCFKDLSLALGKLIEYNDIVDLGTVIVLSFFNFIGILQINEK